VIYRIAEYAGGEHGYLLEHEVYRNPSAPMSNCSFLYCLDSAPIFVATAVFAIPGFFPGRLLQIKEAGLPSPYFNMDDSVMETQN